MDSLAQVSLHCQPLVLLDAPCIYLDIPFLSLDSRFIILLASAFLSLSSRFHRLPTSTTYAPCKDQISCRKYRRCYEYKYKGCGIVLGILFFFSGFFFFWLGVVLGLSRLLFGKTQGWKAGSCGFFRTTSGEMQVPSRFGHKKLLQKANCPVHFCFLCVFIYVDVCVCVFVIEYVVCVFFLLLFWCFIQCTSFLVFAIYLFNV